MKKPLILILLFFGLATSACSETQTISQPTILPASSPSHPVVKDLLTQINEERQRRGLKRLNHNALLSKAALGHAREQMAQNALDHQSQDGRSLADRVNATGYKWRFVAENLAGGQETPEEAVVAWIKSPSHRKNMFATKATEFGAAYVSRPRQDHNDLGHFWVLVLAAPL